MTLLILQVSTLPGDGKWRLGHRGNKWDGYDFMLSDGGQGHRSILKYKKNA
jgi:hypothetical protein